MNFARPDLVKITEEIEPYNSNTSRPMNKTRQDARRKVQVSGSITPKTNIGQVPSTATGRETPLFEKPYIVLNTTYCAGTHE
jgi:hypothetical protein